MGAMLVPASTRELIRLALEEDWGRGDLTAEAVPVAALADARIIARADLVASGLAMIAAIFAEAGISLERLALFVQEGEGVKAGQDIARFRGNARALLGVERTLLNFLQRLFGIATQAAKYRACLAQAGLSHVRITDTRKTIPGWRYLDKMAVRAGGLANHRFGLDSGVLVKENHIRAAGGISAAIRILQATVPHGILIEVEVTNLAEAREALDAGVRSLLLDNFPAMDLSGVVRELKAQYTNIILEASGNIHLDNLVEYARTGVDIISIGALTHSVAAADLSLLFDFQ